MNLRNLILFISLFGVISCTPDGKWELGNGSTNDSIAVEEVAAVEIAESTSKTVKPKPQVSEAETLPSAAPKELPLESSIPDEVVEEPAVRPAVFFDCDHKRERKEARCTEKALQDYVQTGLGFEGIQDSTYTATVRIAIRTNGSVGIVQVLTSTDETFSRALIKTIKQLNTDGLIWTPAMQDSIAVPFDYFTEFEFTF